MPTKYEPLELHLRAIPQRVLEVTLSFQQIERILGASLPESATVHQAWWANQRNSKLRPQAHAWLSAGFVVDSVNQARSNGSVRFKRQVVPPLAVPSPVIDSVRAAQSRVSDILAPKAESQVYQREQVPAVYLVSCVASKQARQVPAKDLYVSDWFRKARAYVESTGMPWFILSAECGLLDPNQPTAPYEKTLNTMPARERKDWAQRVIEQMRTRLPSGPRVVVLAGARYREHLIDYLHERFSQVDLPLEGFRIGEQLHWFSERLRNESP